ncbi:MAG: hypothetical protein NVSMB29_02460 [Candidatus Dormibacteria bacterium]
MIAAVAAFGGDFLRVRERLGLSGAAAPGPRGAAVSRTADASSPPAQQTVLRSQPWWQAVTTLRGAGAASPPPFVIGDGALQWRVQWSCDRGHLLVNTASRPSPAVVDAACPGHDTGYATQTGAQRLKVTAGGAWTVHIDQQVDVPLNEPQLAAMTAPGASVLMKGALYNVDQSGSGAVTIYRLADGTDALRLGGFFVTPNTDLELRLSSAPLPRSTDEYTRSRSDSLAPLDITAGSLNFAIPRAVDPSAYRSLVIWCERLHSVYAAASLVAP